MYQSKKMNTKLGRFSPKNIIYTSSIEKFFLLISEVGLVQEDKNSIPSLNVKIFSENLQQPSKSHRNFFFNKNALQYLWWSPGLWKVRLIINVDWWSSVYSRPINFPWWKQTGQFCEGSPLNHFPGQSRGILLHRFWRKISQIIRRCISRILWLQFWEVGQQVIW